MIFVYIVTIITVTFGIMAAAGLSVMYFPESIRVYAAVGICLLPTLLVSLILLWHIRRHDAKYRRTIFYKVVASLVVCYLVATFLEPFLIQNYIDYRNDAQDSLVASECRGLLFSLAEYAESHDGILPDTIPAPDPQLNQAVSKARFHFTYQRPTPTSAPGTSAPRILLMTTPDLLASGARIVGLENGDVVMETKDAKKTLSSWDGPFGSWPTTSRAAGP